MNGHSWDVIKPLALHYQLHPLSLEVSFSTPYTRPAELISRVRWIYDEFLPS